MAEFRAPRPLATPPRPPRGGCALVCPVVSDLARGQAFASPKRGGFALALVTERLSPKHLPIPVGRSAARQASGHFGQLAHGRQIAGEREAWPWATDDPFSV